MTREEFHSAMVSLRWSLAEHEQDGARWSAYHGPGGHEARLVPGDQVRCLWRSGGASASLRQSYADAAAWARNVTPSAGAADAG